MLTRSFSEKVGYFLGGASCSFLALAYYQIQFKDLLIYNQKASTQLNFQQEFFKYGYPGPISDIRSKQAYVASYNRQTRNPNFVIEHINAETVKKNNETSRDHSNFMEDKAIPELFRGKLNDYKGSGYDRGHMAPAADVKFSQAAMDDTFYLTNMAPQVGRGFNREYWAYFENYCRKLTESFESVYIITGPLYLPSKGPQFPDKDKWYVQYEVIGNPPNIAVPTHFFKVVLAIPKNGTKPSLGGFVLPNKVIPDKVPLITFVTPVDVIERSAGFVMFEKLGADKVKQLPHLCTTTKCELNKKFIDKVKSLNK